MENSKKFKTSLNYHQNCKRHTGGEPYLSEDFSTRVTAEAQLIDWVEQYSKHEYQYYTLNNIKELLNLDPSNSFTCQNLDRSYSNCETPGIYFESNLVWKHGDTAIDCGDYTVTIEKVE